MTVDNSPIMKDINRVEKISARYATNGVGGMKNRDCIKKIKSLLAAVKHHLGTLKGYEVVLPAQKEIVNETPDPITQPDGPDVQEEPTRNEGAADAPSSTDSDANPESSIPQEE